MSRGGQIIPFVRPARGSYAQAAHAQGLASYSACPLSDLAEMCKRIENDLSRAALGQGMHIRELFGLLDAKSVLDAVKAEWQTPGKGMPIIIEALQKQVLGQ